MVNGRIQQTQMEVRITSPTRALYERARPTGISRYE
jgi:hypothetical protein